MIEAAFAKGSRLAGAEVFFTEASGGTGGELSTGILSLTISWTEKRIIRKNIAHSGDALFLPYCPNGINYTVATGADVISSKFTGCYMVKYMVGGGARVGHVATPECNEAWRQIKSRSDVTVVAEFKPTDHSDVMTELTYARKVGGTATPETFGLITSDNRCFAILGVRIQKSGTTTLQVHKLIKV